MGLMLLWLLLLLKGKRIGLMRLTSAASLTLRIRSYIDDRSSTLRFRNIRGSVENGLAAVRRDFAAAGFVVTLRFLLLFGGVESFRQNDFDGFTGAANAVGGRAASARLLEGTLVFSFQILRTLFLATLFGGGGDGNHIDVVAPMRVRIGGHAQRHVRLGPVTAGGRIVDAGV